MMSITTSPFSALALLQLRQQLPLQPLWPDGLRNGSLRGQNADQGLLVAWGGVNQPARREMRSQFFRVRVWDADDLLEAVFRNYDRLDKELQAELPLKRVWSLVEE